MENYIEQLVCEYYKTKGYLVFTNLWIPFNSERERTREDSSHRYSARSWTDVDVIARNNNEEMIQVKATINSKTLAEKIVTYFDRVDNFLSQGLAPDGKSDISWWTKGVKVSKVVIFEDKKSPKPYLKIMHEKGIETICFEDIFKLIYEYIEQKRGYKEQTAVMRLLNYLIKDDVFRYQKK